MIRVLSVEDDAELQHLIGQFLFREGYEVHYAWNGHEGYQKILSLRPDLILLDLMLPIMNGVELLEKLREERIAESIPVVVVSAYGDEVNLLGRSVKALGAADYLRKPVTANDLVACVKKVLSSRPPEPASASELRLMSKGVVRADSRFRTVWVNDRFLANLPPKRFALLRCLMEAPGGIGREELNKRLGYASASRDPLKQDIHRLRKDFGPQEQRRIQTTAEGYELIGDLR